MNQIQSVIVLAFLLAILILRWRDEQIEDSIGRLARMSEDLRKDFRFHQAMHEQKERERERERRP